MKKLEELGVSPWPWHKEFCEFNDEESPFEIVVGDNVSSLDGQFSENDARLIAAAPELYEALREAVLVKCTDCGASDINCAKCAVDRWRSVLSKAAGEEVK